MSARDSLKCAGQKQAERTGSSKTDAGRLIDNVEEMKKIDE